MSAADELEPALVHHIVNSLGWHDLRPLQRAAIPPLRSGDDVLLLAPTAGGKTEAAIFPLLSKMTTESWSGTSLLYLCPLKALLNNLLPRLERYAGWLGRTTALWHGDATTSQRRAILTLRPDILLTTPESLESMLVSRNVDHRSFFAGIRAVVVDEVHTFAGDDRGWHLLAVLERITHMLGHSLQRVGLSATVGNPEQLLGWLQGSSKDKRPAKVVGGQADAAIGDAPRPGVMDNIELDYVGSLENATKVIAALHRGEKRLVFCESRAAVEKLGELLRARDVTTFVSHASLSADERRRAEQAFVESRDCVIVSTSTLELGIDVGDLDRVIQIEAPAQVASFLQRLGRTGRRQGSEPNTLFLTLTGLGLVRAAGLLSLWGKGWVEPVQPPPEPRHILAQQLLALCLQEGRIGDREWPQWWNGLRPFGAGSDVIARYLVEQGFLDADEGMLFIGPAAELRFGYRHFMDLTAVFTGPPEFTVLLGRTDLGRIDPSLLTERVEGPRRLLLGGRSWTVTHVDWARRRCFVEAAEAGGRSRWLAGFGWSGWSFHVTRAMRDVLLGTDPPALLTRRAVDKLCEERETWHPSVHAGGTVITRGEAGDLRWWTWAGHRANATLVATLDEVVDTGQRHDDMYVRLRDEVTPERWRALTADAQERVCLPEPNEKALVGLKFSDALPKHLAMATLSARTADTQGALRVLREPVQFVR